MCGFETGSACQVWIVATLQPPSLLALRHRPIHMGGCHMIAATACYFCAVKIHLSLWFCRCPTPMPGIITGFIIQTAHCNSALEEISPCVAWRIYRTTASMEVPDVGASLVSAVSVETQHTVFYFISREQNVKKSVGPNCKSHYKAILNDVSFSADVLFKCNVIYNKLINSPVKEVLQLNSTC